MDPVTNTKVFQQRAGIEIAPLQGETILFHPESNRFCILNRTSSFIWERLRAPAPTEEIARELAINFDGVSANEALNDVSNTIAELLALDLIVSPPTPDSEFRKD